MENWERQVARILGVPVTYIEKRYYGDDQADALHVDEETMLTFYDYLRDELHFPFPATYTKHSMTCIKLESELSLDVNLGIRIECESEKEKQLIPLTALTLDEADTNASSVALYQAWMQKYK